VEVTRAAGGVSMASPMGFAEALSDDCASPPRLPWVPWSIYGLMTVIGGVGHTLPFLIGEFTVSPDCRCFGGRHRTRCHLLGPPPRHGPCSARQRCRPDWV